MKRKIFLFLLIVVVIAGVWGLVQWRRSSLNKVDPPRPAAVDADLAAHTAVFKKGVEQVTDNVYVAIGYGLANSIMIVGQGGVIIVDAMTTNEEADAVMAEFRKITDKPVKAIVYTHNHADHVFGAEAFARGASPEVYAHASTEGLVMRIVTELRPIIGTRSLRMFGTHLTPEQLVNAGIGPHLGLTPDSTVGFLPPTKTFEDELEAEVAGVRFKLIHAPGETDDQIYLWLPDQKVLLPGDNFYWTFPNLYTIRGTPFRSLKNWYRSLDLARDLKPDYLVPSHSRPIEGADRIFEILTNYRDAIQYVHDQSIRGINMGLTPDELAETVKLPPHLASAPYLQPFYGKVSWSVRSMFSGNLGWFDGDSAHLQPQTRLERARMMVDLAGGEDKLLAKAGEYLKAGKNQQALELTGSLLYLSPENKAALELRVKALVGLAEKEQNPNARHYYLSEALEISRGGVLKETNRSSPESLHMFPLDHFFQVLAVNLDPEASARVDQKVGMIFPDSGQAFLIHVRFGVSEIRATSPESLREAEPAILVEADSRIWKEMLAGLRSPVAALPGFEYPQGGALGFGRFLKLFQPGPMKRAYEPLSVLKGD